MTGQSEAEPAVTIDLSSEADEQPAPSTHANPAGKKTRKRRKKTDNSGHGNNWAKGEHWKFLDSRCNMYFQACADEAWDGFYDSTVDEWVKRGYRLEDIGRKDLPVLVPGEEEAYKRQLKLRAKKVSNLSLCHYN